jgi:hypothetical protein
MKNSLSYLRKELNLNILNEYVDVEFDDIMAQIDYHYIAQLDNGNFAHVILQECSRNFDEVNVILFKDSASWFIEIDINNIKALSPYPKIFAENREEDLLIIEDEKKYSFQVAFLDKKVDWLKLCDVTGMNEYAKAEGLISDTDFINLTESQAKSLGLL